MLQKLDEIHRFIRQNPFFIRFTFLNRYLLALSFIPTGLVKILGKPFTVMTTDSVVGRFFAVFFENQLWYQSVGWAQVFAGIMLLVPKTAHLGAFLFLPIIININLVTIGIGFQGTPFITVAMLLSNLWLLADAFPYWRNWFSGEVDSLTFSSVFGKWERTGIVTGCVGAFLLVLLTRGFGSSWMLMPAMSLLGLGLVATLAGFLKRN